jgi:hypothetical protein
MKPLVVLLIIPLKPKHAMMKSSQLTRSGRSCESCMKHGRDVTFRPGLAALPESVEKSDNRSFLALSISGMNRTPSTIFII